MSDDPIRLVDEAGSELMRSLIAAGREEEPGFSSLERTLAAACAATLVNSATVTSVGASASGSASAGSSAVGAHVALGTAALGTAKGAASSALAIVVKWLVIGVVAGTAASTAAYGVRDALAPPVRSGPAPIAHSGATRAAPQASPRLQRRDEIPDIPPPPVALPARAAPSALSPPEPVSTSPELDRDPLLAAEVAALDGARQALAAGDAGRTLERLNDYEARFPTARMLPEALYLRLEAFTLKGDKSNAEAVAQRILRAYPASPHAARARAVLGSNR